MFLVAGLINFGVKNQVQQVSFKIVVGDLMSFHTLGSDMNLFGFDTILFGSSFKFQEPPVILEVVPNNFGVKNQVPKVYFKIAARDLMSVLSHEFADIIFCEYLDIFEIISDFRSDPFTLIDLELPGNSYTIECTNT